MFHDSNLDLADPVASVCPSRDSDARSEILMLYGEVLRLRASKTPSSSRVIDWCQRAHDLLLSCSGDAQGAIPLWQNLLRPIFCESPFLNRAHAKPRGYAGDYLTIQMMYDAIPTGQYAFAKAIDEWALHQPGPRAVRNRRYLVTDLVQTLRTRFSGQRLSITSLGCGPAAEVFDCLSLDAVHFNLVDIDEEALSHVRAKAVLNSAAEHLTLIQGNIVKMALGRTSALPPNQHAFYSLGVIDYFKDELVIRLLNSIHSRLERGGIVLLGNFRPEHPNANFFVHALDWPLCLRSEDQLLALVRQSHFGESEASVGAEAEGVQIFISCVKS